MSDPEYRYSLTVGGKNVGKMERYYAAIEAAKEAKTEDEDDEEVEDAFRGRHRRRYRQL